MTPQFNFKQEKKQTRTICNRIWMMELHVLKHTAIYWNITQQAVQFVFTEINKQMKQFDLFGSTGLVERP